VPYGFVLVQVQVLDSTRPEGVVSDKGIKLAADVMKPRVTKEMKPCTSETSMMTLDNGTPK
jgi:hypothetical protein